MSTSLVDAIGRRKASRLIGNAVLRAIDENQVLGLGRSRREEKVRMVGGMLCLVGAGTTAPLVSCQRGAAQVNSLKKSVPIA